MSAHDVFFVQSR